MGFSLGQVCVGFILGRLCVGVILGSPSMGIILGRLCEIRTSLCVGFILGNAAHAAMRQYARQHDGLRAAREHAHARCKLSACMHMHEYDSMALSTWRNDTHAHVSVTLALVLKREPAAALRNMAALFVRMEMLPSVSGCVDMTLANICRLLPRRPI